MNEPRVKAHNGLIQAVNIRSCLERNSWHQLGVHHHHTTVISLNLIAWEGRDDVGAIDTSVGGNQRVGFPRRR